MGLRYPDRAAELYPELADGLSPRLRAALAALGSPLEPTWDPPEAFASRVTLASRYAEVQVSTEKRMFVVDLAAYEFREPEPFHYLSGQTPELTEAARALAFWLTDIDAYGETTAIRFPFLVFGNRQRAHEAHVRVRIEEVWQQQLAWAEGQRAGEAYARARLEERAQQQRSVADALAAMDADGGPLLLTTPAAFLLSAAAGVPRLRRLYPGVSAEMAMFSRAGCDPVDDGFPYAGPARGGKFVVYSHATGASPELDLEPALELLAANVADFAAGALAVRRRKIEYEAKLNR